MNKIIRIEEVVFKRSKDDWNSFEGFQVITEEETIKLGISDGQDCCENAGYFMSDDDLSYYEGAELIDITITDTCLKTEKMPEHGLDSGDAMFVNFITDKGTFQFTAYNSHNGYYGHEAVVISKQLNHSQNC